MLFPHYRETTLEQSISIHYKTNHIQAPEDLLDIELIAESFDVILRYEMCKSVSDNKEKIIILDKRAALLLQRKFFFHELCHVLRHVGDQRKMPVLFKDGQEADAESFSLYASMPFFMISQLKIPNHQEDAIQYLASTFKVALKLAKLRLEQIQRRDLQGRIYAESMRQWATNSSVVEETHSHIDETSFYAYYDSTGDFIEPSQIIVHVDKETLMSQEELLFSLEGPFKQIEENELQAFANSKPVKFSDLDYTRDGKISLRLSHLASRYYSSATKFIIHKRDIDQVLHFHGATF
ncbi:ImmA/IrrE family metallo-endopeptidase [Paenibacillus glucanolyticus]|uniref:ImmA/IrrE family metallo-endopeptidase n=1 Tax=Paenibacillus glucanolyticus TaxID=59843 RepID=UPI00128BD4E7|nr:ImmA/IrrE family metallo-endopeptidase [Paenibacillus glucanolyticus]MPY20252.1 ImmA/IrrE family metallo-endopeptidase [Paenibacillus glucanolyticus]